MQLTEVQEYINNAKNMQLSTAKPIHLCCHENEAEVVGSLTQSSTHLKITSGKTQGLGHIVVVV